MTTGEAPGERPARKGLSDIYPIPQAVRTHGKALDPHSLQPGDLLLISSKKPNFVQRQIKKHQALMFNQSHACWQHAAISGGRVEICEATVWGVKARQYWKYMTGEYDIKVRRLKNASDAERALVAYYAAVSTRSSYGFLSALNLRGVLKGGDAWQRPMISTRGIICSQLYFEACMRAGYYLDTIPSQNVCPAHLSLSRHMDDVPVAWVDV